MRRRTSKIWLIKKDQLQKILDENGSIVKVLEKLGYDGYNGNHRTINERIKEDNLNLDKFNENKKVLNQENRKRLSSRNKISNGDIFKKGSSYKSSHSIKKRLMEDFGFIYECSECKISGEYNGKKLSLQLDHIDGVNNNNEVSNLRFLCPNCHSQTSTFSGKKHKIKYFCKCGKSKITKQAELCQSCACNKSAKEKRKFEATEEELYDLVCVQKVPFTRLGKKFNVSDNAVRKRCKKLGVPYRLKDIK